MVTSGTTTRDGENPGGTIGDEGVREKRSENSDSFNRRVGV